MFRSKNWSTVFALAILSLVPGLASASSIAVSGSTFNENFSFPDGTTTFHHGPTEGDSHGYAVDITLYSFGDWGSITLDAQNFSDEDLTFTLSFTLPLNPVIYDEAYSSITGNGTWSTGPFAVSGASLVLDAGPPPSPGTNLGVDVSTGCSVPSNGSSFICPAASADAVFAPRFYNTLYGSLVFSMGGSGSWDASQANQLGWDGSFEVDPVPEPVSLPLIGGGLLALALRRRRA